MYGDFSRFLRRPLRSVLGRPGPAGRLLLDAELNEQNAILLDYLRGLTADLIGPFAGPVHHAGFAVEPVCRDGNVPRRAAGPWALLRLRPALRGPGSAPAADQELRDRRARSAVRRLPGGVGAVGQRDPGPGAHRSGPVRRRARNDPPQPGAVAPGGRAQAAGARRGPDRAGPGVDHPARSTNTTPTRAAGRRSARGRIPAASPSRAPRPRRRPGATAASRTSSTGSRCTVAATPKRRRSNGRVTTAASSSGSTISSEPDDRACARPPWRDVWYDARQGLEVGDWVELVDDHWAPLGTPPPLMQVRGITLATRQVRCRTPTATAASTRGGIRCCGAGTSSPTSPSAKPRHRGRAGRPQVVRARGRRADPVRGAHGTLRARRLLADPGADRDQRRAVAAVAGRARRLAGASPQGPRATWRRWRWRQMPARADRPAGPVHAPAAANRRRALGAPDGRPAEIVRQPGGRPPEGSGYPRPAARLLRAWLRRVTCPGFTTVMVPAHAHWQVAF